MSSNERYNYFCVFTPEGKVLPIESIFRSTEHGGVCVALRNKETGIIIAQRTGKNDKFTDGKSKIKQLDTSLVYSYAGITNDGERFGEEIKHKLQEEKHRTGTVLPIAHLIRDTQFICGLEVMRYGNRAMGASVVMVGVEKGEVTLVEILPTGESIPCTGSCIGARAQSARTVLDAQGDRLLSLSSEELLSLGLAAFQNAVNNPAVISSGSFDVCTVSASAQAAAPVTFTPGSSLNLTPMPASSTTSTASTASPTTSPTTPPQS
ncbi:2S proteasome subunit alpha 6 [Nematocida displodere]|uniref:2S proteasome subunit alpha 6 n=1 Tax=Nematocida displodere TaxID=1805483 RepID=A0A177EIU0_9MICR|nr:2S proteasome subunit alpha 6 [Nematocida displodere]